MPGRLGARSSPLAPSTEPEPWEEWVSLDPAGRPYDEYMPTDGEYRLESIGRIHLPDGKLVIANGNDLSWLGESSADDAITLGDAEDYQVDVVRFGHSDPSVTSVAALILRVTAEPVATWSAFDTAYGTDGGVGAVASTAYLQVNGQRSDEEQERAGFEQLDDLDATEGGMVTYDVDGLPGMDAILFYNGSGDGAFPMTRGTSADGKLARLVIWHQLLPWRLAFPEGVPPPDVTDHEDLLVECLAGKTTVPVNGTCVLHD